MNPNPDLSRSRLWADPAIGMIGRKTIFAGKIKDILESASGFVIKGEPGIGLSALLEACYDVAQTKGKVALVSGKDPLSAILKSIAEQWNIDIETEKKTPSQAEIQRALLAEKGHLILIDDMNRLSPKGIDFIKLMNQYHRVSGAVHSGKTMKEELRQILWSKEDIKISRLDSKHSVILAEKMCQHFGTAVSFRDVANTSMGLPGRIYASAKSGKIIRNEIRMASEEIDLSPLIIISLCCVMLFRYLGRAIEASDLVILSGIGIIAMIVGRSLLTAGKNK